MDDRKIQLAQIEYLKILLIGENPFRMERLWSRLISTVRFPYVSTMISAVDMALWDIAARALQVPVFELLGRMIRDKIRVYPHLRGTWNCYPVWRWLGTFGACPR